MHVLGHHKAVLNDMYTEIYYPRVHLQVQYASATLGANLIGATPLGVPPVGVPPVGAPPVGATPVNVGTTPKGAKQVGVTPVIVGATPVLASHNIDCTPIGSTPPDATTVPSSWRCHTYRFYTCTYGTYRC